MQGSLSRLFAFAACLDPGLISECVHGRGSPATKGKVFWLLWTKADQRLCLDFKTRIVHLEALMGM